jgi:ketosteroid isomerase-like protein
MPSADHADVLAAFDELFEALLSSRDADAGTRLFAEEDHPVMWGSERDERASGLAQIAALHRGIVDFPGELSFRWDGRSVHVHGDAAWVNADGHVTVVPVGGEPRTTPYRLTAVLVRRASAWRWHTFNGSEPNRAT